MVTQYIFSGLLLIVATGLYTVTQLWCFGQLKWSNDDFSDPRKMLSNPGFWSRGSWQRKYKNGGPGNGPKFWQSTGLLVFLTDGYHLFQFLQFRAIAVAVALLTPWPWIVFAVLFCGLPFFSWLFQKLLSR